MNFRRFDAIIDVRSPAEYAEDHIPGAISAPVLDDAQRAEVGTRYKRESAFEAKKVGAALIAKNVARHIEQFKDSRNRGIPGLLLARRKRSAAMAHVMREIGWDAETLEGGYKAYRRLVVSQLRTLPSGLDFIVIHGPTGSGKSRLLGALKRAGAQVLDLEELAAHRGSVLGNLPDRPQPTQKMFESLLLQQLSNLQPQEPVYVEGESKKIGELQVPEALMTRMRASPCVVRKPTWRRAWTCCWTSTGISWPTAPRSTRSSIAWSRCTGATRSPRGNPSPPGVPGEIWSRAC